MFMNTNLLRIYTILFFIISSFRLFVPMIIKEGTEYNSNYNIIMNFLLNALLISFVISNKIKLKRINIVNLSSAIIIVAAILYIVQYLYIKSYICNDYIVILISSNFLFLLFVITRYIKNNLEIFIKTLLKL